MIANNALESARALLLESNATCVIMTDGEPIVSFERGVKPLLALIDEGRDVSGCAAADKVVGKAAAMLYILLGVSEIYASVISDLALKAFANSNIRVTYGERVPMIRNRTNTGFCPMEQATRDIENPKDALDAIRATLKALAASAK